jgi:hypothetical protein
MDILIHCVAETGGTTLQKSGRAKKYLNEISQKSGIGNGKRLQQKNAWQKHLLVSNQRGKEVLSAGGDLENWR